MNAVTPMEKTAREIAARLRARGHVAYFAGGCVRDLLRGEISKDIDIATDARPEVVREIFSRTYAVGAHFGVIVVLEKDFQFEVATFRSDGAYLDGRRPTEVHFSSPEKDAARRDFTINGMFFDPARDEVIDFVGGRVDLEARLIRAIGDPVQRFKEDRLRMLRAVRFATVLQFDIEAGTWNALLQDASAINEISAERIRDELVRIFMSPLRTRGWDLLDASGLLYAIFPEKRNGLPSACVHRDKRHRNGKSRLQTGNLFPEQQSRRNARPPHRCAQKFPALLRDARPLRHRCPSVFPRAINRARSHRRSRRCDRAHSAGPQSRAPFSPSANQLS
jgi:tRNA nucleotidyltransferase/poly(A) polymerase